MSDPSAPASPELPVFRIGVLGRGTVGGAFAELVERHSARVQRITGMRLSPTGDVLIITTNDGLARIWSLRTGQLAATARLRDSVDMASVAVSDRLEAAILRRSGGADRSSHDCRDCAGGQS